MGVSEIDEIEFLKKFPISKIEKTNYYYYGQKDGKSYVEKIVFLHPNDPMNDSSVTYRFIVKGIDNWISPQHNFSGWNFATSKRIIRPIHDTGNDRVHCLNLQ